MVSKEDVGILQDLVLSIGVHSFSHGIVAQEKGKFFLLDGISVESAIVKKLTAWYKVDESNEHRVDHVRSKSTPR